MRKTGKISEPIDTDWGLTCQSSEQQSGATPHLSKMPHRNGRRPFAGWLAMANQLSYAHTESEGFLKNVCDGQTLEVTRSDSRGRKKKNQPKPQDLRLFSTLPSVSHTIEQTNMESASPRAGVMAAMGPEGSSWNPLIINWASEAALSIFRLGRFMFWAR